jgi:hypothetical protein
MAFGSLPGNCGTHHIVRKGGDFWGHARYRPKIVDKKNAFSYYMRLRSAPGNRKRIQFNSSGTLTEYGEGFCVTRQPGKELKYKELKYNDKKRIKRTFKR